MWITKSISLTVFLLTLQDVFSNICESNRYSSPFANYYKLVGDKRSYYYWAKRCTELGSGWNVAAIDNMDEKHFIELVHIHAYDQRAYWIGSNNQFLGTNRFTDIEIYTGNPSDTLNGILCEQAKERPPHAYTLCSATSCYHKLEGARKPYSDWSSMCAKELGPGWAPAFFETQREIDFVRQPQDNVVSPFVMNYLPYWIAGTVNLDLTSVTRHYPVCTFNTTRSETFPVRVTPGLNIFEEVDPSTLEGANVLDGILCEKTRI